MDNYQWWHMTYDGIRILRLEHIPTVPIFLVQNMAEAVLKSDILHLAQCKLSATVMSRPVLVFYIDIHTS
jgi:hypothetical protein